MSFVSNPQGDTKDRIRARSERLAQEARLRSGTVRMPPLSVHLTNSLIRQRVEARIRARGIWPSRDVVGVVSVVERGSWIGVARPIAFDSRGFWTHEEAIEVFSRDSIERLTVLEGPAGEVG